MYVIYVFPEVRKHKLSTRMREPIILTYSLLIYAALLFALNIHQITVIVLLFLEW